MIAAALRALPAEDPAVACGGGPGGRRRVTLMVALYGGGLSRGGARGVAGPGALRDSPDAARAATAFEAAPPSRQEGADDEARWVRDLAPVPAEAVAAEAEASRLQGASALRAPRCGGGEEQQPGEAAAAAVEVAPAWVRVAGGGSPPAPPRHHPFPLGLPSSSPARKRRRRDDGDPAGGRVDDDGDGPEEEGGLGGRLPPAPGLRFFLRGSGDFEALYPAPGVRG